ncbi:MAG: germination lipoprotein GerS-related protein [Clostridium sp.]|uniref:germination lipoprotein GerS-related protein n=1 Tax=Clostridium sp. TaxID=1506 RepID=UPI003F35C8CE
MKLLENKSEEKKRDIKRKVKLAGIVILPIIIIGTLIAIRNIIGISNEELVDKMKNMKEYNSIVEFTVRNARGEYLEKAKVHYSENHDPIIEFGDRLVKTYTKDSIQMKYKDGKEYNLEKDTDSFYILSVLNELLKYPIISIEEGSAEWEDLKYTKVSIDIVSNNQHLDKAILYIDKKEKIPMLIKIQDVNGEERVKIQYRDFEKKDKCK